MKGVVDSVKLYERRCTTDFKDPLPRVPNPDKLLWHFDKRGEYTVKSGYQVALKLKFPDQPNNLDSGQLSWNVIWS